MGGGGGGGRVKSDEERGTRRVRMKDTGGRQRKRAHRPFPVVQLRIQFLSTGIQNLLHQYTCTGSRCWGNDHQDGHYWTPGERGNGLLEIVEVRGCLKSEARKKGERKTERGPLFKHTPCIM